MRQRPRQSASVLDRITGDHRNGAAVLHPHIAGLTDPQDPASHHLCRLADSAERQYRQRAPATYTVRNLGNLVPTDPTIIDAAPTSPFNQPASARS